MGDTEGEKPLLNSEKDKNIQDDEIAAVSATVATARLRRSRGYGYEHRLVEKINAIPGWQARRLGGSSTGLPDIVATNNDKSILLTIEAKSGVGGALYVPPDQIERCELVDKMFSLYKERHIILAFKFLSKKRVVRKGLKAYEPRDRHEFYFDAKSVRYYLMQKPDAMVKCTYGGNTSMIRPFMRGEQMFGLPQYVMPFQIDGKKKK